MDDQFKRAVNKRINFLKRKNLITSDKAQTLKSDESLSKIWSAFTNTVAGPTQTYSGRINVAVGQFLE